MRSYSNCIFDVFMDVCKLDSNVSSSILSVVVVDDVSAIGSGRVIVKAVDDDAILALLLVSARRATSSSYAAIAIGALPPKFGPCVVLIQLLPLVDNLFNEG